MILFFLLIVLFFLSFFNKLFILSTPLQITKKTLLKLKSIKYLQITLIDTKISLSEPISNKLLNWINKYLNQKRNLVSSVKTNFKINCIHLFYSILKYYYSLVFNFRICNLECGSDGTCDNSEGTSRCMCPFGKTGNNCMEGKCWNNWIFKWSVNRFWLLAKVLVISEIICKFSFFIWNTIFLNKVKN